MLATDIGKPHEVRTLVAIIFVVLSSFILLIVFWCLNFSRNNIGEGSKHVDKLRDNWSQHGKTHDNFLNQDKFLKSSFLLSLPTQRPCVEGAMATSLRYISCYFLKLILLRMLGFFGTSGLSLALYLYLMKHMSCSILSWPLLCRFVHFMSALFGFKWLQPFFIPNYFRSVLDLLV